jgi:transcriptional regulator with XRE-family HTH domain
MSEQDRGLAALGRAVRQVREERNMSTATLAAAAGIDHERLNTIEAGLLDPGYDVLRALADGLGIELTTLLSRVGDLDMSAISIAFGQRLRELRTKHNVSLDNLARRTGLHATAIGRFERGAREPRLKTILRLAHSLGVPPGALLDDLARHGERRLTPEEFEQHFGDLPTDGEG